MKRFLLLSILLLIAMFVTVANAADTTHFVTTGCANNGNGTAASCAGAPAGAGAWNTCAAMVAGEVAAQPNLTTRGGNLIIEFATTGAADTAACNTNGFTGMGVSNVLRLQSTGANRHGATWDTAKYRLSGSNVNNGLLILNSDYTEVDGLQLENSGTGGGNYYGITSTNGISIKITNNLFRRAAACASGTCEVIYLFKAITNARTIIANNSIVIGYSAAAGGGNVIRPGGGNSGEITTVYNNTCYSNTSQCFLVDGSGASDTLNFKNNVMQGSAIGYGAAASFTTNNHVTNITADATSPDVAFRSKTVLFTSTTLGSENFQLSSSDAEARDQGTDLSADATYPFSTDILSVTRPVNSVWDIGAYEAPLVGGASTVPVLKGGGLI